MNPPATMTGSSACSVSNPDIRQWPEPRGRRARISVTLDACDRRFLEGMATLYSNGTAFEPPIAPLDPERFVAMCLATLPHVQRVLEVAGYQVSQLSIFMVAEMSAPPEEVLLPQVRSSRPEMVSASPVEKKGNSEESIFMTAEIQGPPEEVAAAVPLEFVEGPAEMRHEPMRESWIGFTPMRIRALAGGEEVGSIGWVLLPHVADRLGAPCMNIWALGVREANRRQGIASALVSRALARSYPQGARFASVGTQLWNAPAHATYARFGFGPHCLLVGRTLAPGA